jgi:integrase
MVPVPNIKPVKAKGKTYYYHRKTGERLPDDLADRAERAIAINRSLKAGPRKPAPESVEAVVREYLKSPEFLDLSPNSRELYRHYIDTLRRAIGAHPIASVTRRHILAIRDAQAHKPSAANMAVKVARVLLAFAMDRELRTDNPAQRVKALKVGCGHRTWSPSDIDHFLAYAPPDMTMALKLGLYTGQRLGDVLKMTWADYDGTAMRVVQSKTGERLWIPAARELRAALGAWPRQGLLILGLKRPTFRDHWRKVILAAGLDGLTYHGLRYTAAAKLAEAGCDVRQIAAITGHRSLAMLQKYTRGADQKRLAGAAIRKLERTEQKQKPENFGKPRE